MTQGKCPVDFLGEANLASKPLEMMGKQKQPGDVVEDCSSVAGNWHSVVIEPKKCLIRIPMPCHMTKDK